MERNTLEEICIKRMQHMDVPVLLFIRKAKAVLSGLIKSRI